MSPFIVYTTLYADPLCFSYASALPLPALACLCFFCPRSVICCSICIHLDSAILYLFPGNQISSRAKSYGQIKVQRHLQKSVYGKRVNAKLRPKTREDNALQLFEAMSVCSVMVVHDICKPLHMPRQHVFMQTTKEQVAGLRIRWSEWICALRSPTYCI